MLGAVLIGGQVMRTLPHDQTLIFPVGSIFPNATRFSASWRQPGDSEPRGGVTLAFSSAPPLQIRHHASLPDGDYIVTIDIVRPSAGAEPGNHAQGAETNGETGTAREGLQTNIERRVNLQGGETTIALAANTSVSE